MKYMLIMNCPKNGYEAFGSMPQADIMAHIGYMQQLNTELKNAGEFVSAEGLETPQAAKRVRAGKDGKPIIDGAFAETKEFTAGYWIVEVDGPERAYELAAKASAAPGPGGVPLNMSIEVRQVMCAPPEIR